MKTVNNKDILPINEMPYDEVWFVQPGHVVRSEHGHLLVIPGGKPCARYPGAGETERSKFVLPVVKRHEPITYHTSYFGTIHETRKWLALGRDHYLQYKEDFAKGDDINLMSFATRVMFWPIQRTTDDGLLNSQPNVNRGIPGDVKLAVTRVEAKLGDIGVDLADAQKALDEVLRHTYPWRYTDE